jgi:hypothetical protein
MIMLQAGSNSEGPMMWPTRSLLSRTRPSLVGTFRNTPWIRCLNDLLLRELQTISVYQGAATVLHEWGLDHETVIKRHQEAARELVRLVVHHRGIPADDRGAHVSLTAAMLQICSVMGTMRRVALSRLTGLETGLAKAYEAALKDAPRGDDEVLKHLMHLASGNPDVLGI